MDNLASLFLSLIVLIFVIWFWIFLPLQMANRRNRSAVIWLLISILFSPILAILLLLALGNDKSPE